MLGVVLHRYNGIACAVFPPQLVCINYSSGWKFYFTTIMIRKHNHFAAFFRFSCVLCLSLYFECKYRLLSVVCVFSIDSFTFLFFLSSSDRATNTVTFLCSSRTEILSFISTAIGFEPMRAMHNGLAGHRLNHSAKLSHFKQ